MDPLIISYIVISVSFALFSVITCIYTLIRNRKKKTKENIVVRNESTTTSDVSCAHNLVVSSSNGALTTNNIAKALTMVSATDNVAEKSKIMCWLLLSSYILIHIIVNTGGDYNDNIQTERFSDNMTDDRFSQISQLERVEESDNG